VRLSGHRDGVDLELETAFVIDASGPGGFLARQLQITSGLDATETNSGLVFSHFTGVGSVRNIVPGLPDGPYPDDWAAVHHVIDEGWMYSLRFDHGVTSAGFVITPRGLAGLELSDQDPVRLWNALLRRYPTIGSVFEQSTPTMPIRFVPRIQHRLTQATGSRWVLLPHAYAFVDPLFSTGIAWGLRAIERLALAFESRSARRSLPNANTLDRYGTLLAAEADQIDHIVAAAYESMAHFDLFAAHAMIYFATVSYAEVKQRVVWEDDVAWRGFLGVGDAVLGPLPRESLRRLREITRRRGDAEDEATRRRYVEWARGAIAPRNVVGLADPARHNLYPVDLDRLIDRHALLGLSREELVAALPALRGVGPEPVFAESGEGRSTLPRDRRATEPQAPAPR
jgi:FADH2 O2-dependent halogenase